MSVQELREWLSRRIWLIYDARSAKFKLSRGLHHEEIFVCRSFRHSYKAGGWITNLGSKQIPAVSLLLVSCFSVGIVIDGLNLIAKGSFDEI